MPWAKTEPARTGGWTTTATGSSPQCAGRCCVLRAGIPGLDFQMGTDICWALAVCGDLHWALSPRHLGQVALGEERGNPPGTRGARGAVSGCVGLAPHGRSGVGAPSRRDPVPAAGRRVSGSRRRPRRCECPRPRRTRPRPRLALLPPPGGVPGTRRGGAKGRVAERVPGAAAGCAATLVLPSVCPAARPAMAALAPAPRILLLLLLLLQPPPGGEPLGVGEFVPARDGGSHVHTVPAQSPGSTIPRVPPTPHPE